MNITRHKLTKPITAGDNTTLCEVLHPAHTGLNTPYSLALVTLGGGCGSVKHRLKSSSEVYHIIAGTGTACIDGQNATLAEGDTLYIAPGQVQSITNSGQGELRFLCVVSPPWSKEDEEICVP